jgi:formylglycine-generating enzyme required for sulfatase activity
MYIAEQPAVDMVNAIAWALRGDKNYIQPTEKTSAASVENPAPVVEPGGMVRIPGGTFTMGSPPGEPEREEEAQHQVTVSPFSMGQYEVTVAEFRAFVNATGYRTTAEISGGGMVWVNNKWEQKADANWRNPYFSQGDSQPVVLVSWYDAIEYCNWRSQNKRLKPAYTIDKNHPDPNNKNQSDNLKWIVGWNRGTTGYRLPTEAEWEYACRAGTATPFSTGDNITTEQANYNGNYPYNGNTRGVYHQKPVAVGSFPPNPFGLYDMHGNVFEWCWDWSGGYALDGAQTDPSGAASGSIRVIRGGSWYGSARVLRSAGRYYVTPSGRYSSVGFRLVRP